MSYEHLNVKERHTLMFLLQYGLSYREIGRRLDRSHTSISREVKRNTRKSGCYTDDSAQELALNRRQTPRHARKQYNQPLVNYVINNLRKDWSPETIAGRLKNDFPRNHEMRISPETVYQWIFSNAKNGGDLYQNLIRKHKKRRKQMPYGTGRGLIPDRVSISDRPEAIENRGRFGHWESDSVLGAKGSGGIATHVERKSRLTIAEKLSDQCAETFTVATVSAFSLIPEAWKKTLTVDNGKEFAGFKLIEKGTGMDVYFCDPYLPWQRGTNENTNDLLRYYFPKGIDWRSVSNKELEVAVDKLNNRPRKCLNYQTLNEVF